MSHARRQSIHVALAASVVVAGACTDRHEPATFSAAVAQVRGDPSPAPRRRVELTSLDRQLATLQRRRMTVTDPVYGKQKTYEGYLLRDVVRTAFGEAAGGGTADLVFVCLDGYQPLMPIARVDQRALLATRDVDAPAGAAWEMASQGRTLVSPAPYYVVWRDLAGESIEDRPWPYGVVALEVRAPSSLPGADSREPAVRSGAALFRRECIKCHSVNLVGGAVGPELNVPMNVTQYWQSDVLRRYIPNPGAVRAGSRMPAFPQLSSADVDSLIAYLTFVRNVR